MQIAGFKELLLAKDEENKKLKEQLIMKNTLKYEKPYYWLIDNEKKDGPFCQQCYDSDNKLIRLQDNNNGKWSCLSCRFSFTDSTHRSNKK